LNWSDKKIFHHQKKFFPENTPPFLSEAQYVKSIADFRGPPQHRERHTPPKHPPFRELAETLTLRRIEVCWRKILQNKILPRVNNKIKSF